MSSTQPKQSSSTIKPTVTKLPNYKPQSGSSAGGDGGGEGGEFIQINNIKPGSLGVHIANNNYGLGLQVTTVNINSDLNGIISKGDFIVSFNGINLESKSMNASVFVDILKKTNRTIQSLPRSHNYANHCKQENHHKKR